MYSIRLNISRRQKNYVEKLSCMDWKKEYWLKNVDRIKEISRIIKSGDTRSNLSSRVENRFKPIYKRVIALCIQLLVLTL